MARIMRKSKPKAEASTQVQFSEVIIFIAVAIALLAGLRYYFFVYRTSAGYILGDYLNAVNHGEVEKQYDLIDDSDKKKYYPTRDDYDKNAPQAHGYTERIIGWQPSQKPSSSDTIPVDVTIDLRAKSAGKALTEVGSSASVKDTYVMHKDTQGRWKVWLEKSKRMLLKEPPNDKSNF